MNKIFNYFIYLVIFQSLVSSNSNIKLKKNITSLLNTTDLISFNNQIIASTNGGIYSIDNQSYSVHNDDLDIYDISCISKENDKLWIGSNTYGSIQVLNSDFNLIKKIDYPSFDKIKDIAFSNNHAYSIVVNENEDYIARYLIDSMQYLDIIDLVDGKINDIKIDENFVYVLTDAGYYKGELNSGNYLALNQYWDGPFYNEYDMLSFELSSGIFIASKNEEYYSIHDENIHLIDNLNDDFVNTYNINNSSFLLTKNSLYTLTQSTPPLIEMVYSKETMNFEQLNDFTSYTFLNNNHYFGLKNNGVLIYSNELSDLFIPNTIYKNQFDAIYYTENEKLIGVANHGIYSNKLSGGFVYSEVLSNNNNNENINNFYSWPSYKINNFPESSNFYKTDVLNYWFGGKTSYSISIIDNNIYFSNSGIYNDEDINNVGWDPMSNFYDFYASEFSFYDIPEYNDLTYGGVVSLNLSNLNSFTLENVWSMNGSILDGNYGIKDDNKPYMTVNQINKDNNNNLYIVNPNAEKYNRPIVVKPYNSETFRHISNDQYSDNAYEPTEITFDQFNNIWVAFKYHELSQDENYSSGGIRMIDVNNLEDELYDWNNFTSSPILSEFSYDLYHTNVFSIDIGKDNFNNEILWVLTDKGVQGYILYSSFSSSGNYSVEFQRLNNNFYFTNLSFEEGDKIRVDKQNNAWITTKTNGLYVINNYGEVWPENGGAIDFNQYNILSDIIYDIDFDEFGNVFVATELGISILETSFAANKNPKNISVSPNPFKIGVDNEIIFTNIPKESSIKIMNLSGLVVKEFFVSTKNRIFYWNGINKYGEFLKTGIYLVSIYNHLTGESGVTKLAIIK